MKDTDETKKSKRTPSFNLRRRTRSFKDKYKLPTNLPPAVMENFVDRKQELQSGGKKATIRSWKTFYTVLFGQLLCFFKDREGSEYRWKGLKPHLHIRPWDLPVMITIFIQQTDVLMMWRLGLR